MTLRKSLALLVLAALALAPGVAAAQDAAAPLPATTLGGLQLSPGNDGTLPLSAVSPPPLSFSLEAPDAGGLPLATGDAASPTLPGLAGGEATRTLGTRLSLGQPLGLEALGGSVDWRAAATVEPGPQGDAYGLSLSIGSLSDGGPLPSSDLRLGLTYGNAPATGEQGVLLDFSYRF